MQWRREKKLQNEFKEICSCEALSGSDDLNPSETMMKNGDIRFTAGKRAYQGASGSKGRQIKNEGSKKKKKSLRFNSGTIQAWNPGHIDRIVSSFRENLKCCRTSYTSLIIIV